MMTEQASHAQPLMERDVLPPSAPLTTSEIIIPGYDTYTTESELGKSVEQEVVASPEGMLDNFFDDYTAFVNDQSPVYVYDRPAQHRYDTSYRLEYSRSEVAEQKLAELEKYVRVGFIQGNLAINPSVFEANMPVTIDAIVEAFMTDAVIRAQVRYDDARTEGQAETFPAHISVEKESTEAEAPKFYEQVKEFGSRAIRALNLHSGSVTLPQTKLVPTVQIEVVEQK